LEPLEIGRALLRRLWLLVLLVVLGVGLEWYLTVRQPPQYEATVTLLINPASPSGLIPYLNRTIATGPSVIPTLAASYTAYLKSRSFGELAAQRLNTTATPDQLAGSIRTSLVPNTNMMTVSVRWDNPTEAARLANELTQLFINERRQGISSPANDQAAIATQFYLKRVEALRAQWDEINDSPTLTPEQKSAGMERLLTILTPAEENYARWAQVAAANELARQTGVDTASILDPAPVPGGPTGPNLRRNLLLGALMGLALGAVLASLLHYVDNTIRTGEDVARLAGLPVLGSVMKLSRSEAGPSHLIGAANSRSPAAEAYRAIRTNLQFTTAAQRCRSILVTSPGRGEGRSTTAANLAVVLAQAGKRVVLVSSDLRQPKLHLMLGTAGEPGLSELLAGGQGDAVALLRQTREANLRLLPSGAPPPNPTELLESPRLAQILQQLADVCDAVVLDSPPVLSAADATILGARADGVILVAEAGRTRGDALQRSVATLIHGAATILGVVIIKRSRWSGDGQYYIPSTEGSDGVVAADGLASGARAPAR
jgi:succinoglycan biosynthesis transport protein ExoP